MVGYADWGPRAFGVDRLKGQDGSPSKCPHGCLIAACALACPWRAKRVSAGTRSREYGASSTNRGVNHRWHWMTIITIPLNAEKMLMKDLDRFRRPEQPLLFDPPRVLPTWVTLPPTVRLAVTRVVVKMLIDHRTRLVSSKPKGRAEDE